MCPYYLSYDEHLNSYQFGILLFVLNKNNQKMTTATKKCIIFRVIFYINIYQKWTNFRFYYQYSKSILILDRIVSFPAITEYACVYFIMIRVTFYQRHPSLNYFIFYFLGLWIHCFNYHLVKLHLSHINKSIKPKMQSIW